MKRLIYQFIENILPPNNLWGVKIYFDLIQYKAFINKHPFFNEEKKINSLIKELILEFDTQNFIDIGSNVGIHGLTVAKKYPKIKVYNFEPNSRLIKLQKRSIIKNNLQNVELFDYALSDKNKDGFLYTTYTSTGESSLIPLDNLGFKKKIHVKRFDEFSVSDNIGVKIDVEGNELNVLKGFGDKIKNVNWMIIEINDEFLKHSGVKSNEIISLLKKEGLFISKNFGLNYMFKKIK